MISRHSLCRTALGLVLGTSLASAANRTWDGDTDANWTTAGNWDVLPAAGDTLIFAGVTGLSNNNDFTAGTSFTGLTFSAGAGQFVLGGNALTVGNTTALNVAVLNSSGVLQTINNNVTLSNAQQTWNVGAGGVTVGGVISAGGTASRIDLTGGTLTVNGNGSVLSGSAGRVFLVAGANLTIGNGITASTAKFDGSGGTLTFGNSSSVLNITNGGGETFAGTISGAGTLAITGGNSRLSGNNSGWTGTYEIKSGDNRLSNVNNLGSATIKLNSAGAANATTAYFNVNNPNVANHINVAGNGSFRFNGGTGTLSGSVTGSGTFALSDDDVWNITGNWTSTNTFSSAFSGTLSLGGEGGNFGTRRTSTININSATASSAQAAYVLNSVSAGNVILQSTITGGGVVNFGSLTGAASSIVRGNIAGTTTFSVGALGTSTTYAGVITDGTTPASMFTAFTKVGGGTLELSGTNSYTGATAVDGGKLLVNGSLAAASTVTVQNAGSTLGGTGTVNGNVIVKAGAILAAGDSTVNGGVDTFAASTGTNSLTLESGSIFAWDLAASVDTDTAGSRGTSYDGIDAGSISATDAVFRIILGSTALAELQSGTSPFWTADQSWSDIFTGAFAGNFSAVQVFDSSNTNITSSIATYGSFSSSLGTLGWSAVPEPSAALAGLLVGAGALRRRRRY